MTETPIYDKLVLERFTASLRKFEEAIGRITKVLVIASGGSLSQEVSASSASRHSLQDSSRPEGSRPEMVIDSWANVVEFEIEYKEGDL